MKTKPGSEPAELSDWIASALDLDAVKSNGGTFAYPDGLEVREWVALKALEAARAIERDKEMKERERERQGQSTHSRLEGLSNRGRTS